MRYADNVSRKTPETRLDAPSLPPKAAHAARLEATGSPPIDLARQLSVDISTVKRWRNRDDYRALVEEIAEQANARIIDRATSLRLKAIKLMERAVDAASAMLDTDGDDLTADALGKIAKIGLDAYKTTAAQTGITEASKVEVSVSPPEEALRKLEARLREIPAPALQDADPS